MAKGQADGKRSEPASRSNEAVKAVKGLAWRLPVLKTQDLGKIGPGLGVGAGCGVGVGFGLFGGAGLGLGMPGLHVGLGAGVGCGIGLGFGYGVGKGIAFDENGKYTNVGKLFQRPSNHQIGALVDEVVFNAKRLVQATSKEIEKWR